MPTQSFDVAEDSISGTSLSSLDGHMGCSLKLDVGIIIAVTLQAVTCILGLVGNVFVILAIVTTRKLQTTTSVYIGNLTVLDLLTCVLMMPAHIVGMLCGGWPLGDVTCKIVGHMMWCITCLALFTLAVIATSRYLLVARSASSYDSICSRSNVLICLLALWTTSIFIYVVPVTVLMNKDLVTISFSVEYATCNVVVIPDIIQTPAAVTWVLSLPLLLFIIVGCVWIPLQFILTFCAVRKSKQRIRNLALAQRRPLFRLGLSKEEIHLTKILLLIYIVFFVLWLPLVLNITLITVFAVPSQSVQKHIFTLYLAGSALNPFIYGWLNSNFRAAFRRLLSKHCFACKCRKNPVDIIG